MLDLEVKDFSKVVLMNNNDGKNKEVQKSYFTKVRKRKVSKLVDSRKIFRQISIILTFLPL